MIPDKGPMPGPLGLKICRFERYLGDSGSAAKSGLHRSSLYSSYIEPSQICL